MKEKKLTDEELDKLIKALEYQSWSQNLFELSQASYMLKYQKTEIERLTEEHKKDTMLLYASGLACEQVKAENAELQKQVDVLTAEKENLYFLNKNLEDYIDNHEPIWKRNTEQAVKDTAKEIFMQIFESCVFSFKGNEDYKKGFCDALEQYDKQLRDLAKQNGVEVE